MATVTNLLLVVLVVCGAFVLSEYETTQLIDATSPEYAEALRQMEIVINNQWQLMNKLEEQGAIITQLQEVADGLWARFRCNYTPCRKCTCIYLSLIHI